MKNYANPSREELEHFATIIDENIEYTRDVSGTSISLSISLNNDKTTAIALLGIAELDIRAIMLIAMEREGFLTKMAVGANALSTSSNTLLKQAGQALSRRIREFDEDLCVLLVKDYIEEEESGEYSVFHLLMLAHRDKIEPDLSTALEIANLEEGDVVYEKSRETRFPGINLTTNPN